MDISIICFTYNHEKYVRKTLEGFLMQKGDFEYEVIIHDDASQDGTVDILKEYKERYPDKIRLVIQRENQYSKGIKDFRPYFYPLINGKYMAFCEGDDFWIYDYKLQKQYELMEKNPGISLCYHNALVYQEKSDLLRLNMHDHPSGFVEDRDVINVTKGWYPTSSILCRTDYMMEQPDFCETTGDEVWRTYLACRGDLYYINRAWSVYREFSDSGWNTRYYCDKKLAQNHFKDTVEYFREFNQYSKGRFEVYIKERLFQGIHKYRDAHYGMDCSVNELKRCLNELKSAAEHRIDQVLDEYYSIYAIRCKDYYKTAVEDKLKEEEKKYIYGAGNEAIKALIELDKHNMAPQGFIISNPCGYPPELLNIPIYEVGNFVFDKEKCIWPCLIDGREDVLMILQDKGCKKIVI